MKSILTLFLLSIFTINAYSQIIEIGSDYKTVSELIDNKVRTENINNRKSNFKRYYEIRNNVIRLYENSQYFIDLNTRSRTFVDFIFKDKILIGIDRFILDLNLEELKKRHNNYYHKIKIGGYYFKFSKSYSSYQEVKLVDNYSCIVERLYISKDFIDYEYYNKIEKAKKAAVLKQQDEIRQKELIKELDEKFYIIDQYKSGFSEDILERVCKLYKHYTFKELLIDSEFDDVFKENIGYYEIRYFSDRNSSMAESEVYSMNIDKYYPRDFFSTVAISLPEIYIDRGGEKYSINREAFVQYQFNVLKGKIDVKVKNGKVINYPLELLKVDNLKNRYTSKGKNLIELIDENVKSFKNGNYKISYSIGSLNNIELNKLYFYKLNKGEYQLLKEL